MRRYAAFLRGVSPMNCKMPELKRAFEEVGFGEVRTVLSSGNVVFTAREAADTALERKAEAAMQKHLGRTFLTIVRSVEELQALLAADPFAKHRLPAASKRIVTFLREAPPRVPALPEQDGARILHVRGREAFSTYLPTPKGPVFMTLIEKTFGKDVTTRTWDTVKKVAR
ncbi:MAG TPA: DUF1697 domain-containing protein [Gemmatimonadales bacterium]|jgi:uncharacterized protein (DUF1697 family)|nr:DUF1697 domain-containing protein [Gemmatimonadales bacterium]